MGIEMIGIDHTIAGIDIRSIFSFTQKRKAEVFAYMKTFPGLEGTVVLSTCNRMEFWISTNQDWDQDLYQVVCGFCQVDPEAYLKYFTFRKENEAVHHLFRLAGGLESRILGEDQILTQVGEALDYARECYSTDHILETLFRQAVTAGKRIKTEVVLTVADHSVVDSAIHQLKEKGYVFSGKKCMVIGNGVMGKLAATKLVQEGAQVTVTIRQYRSGMVNVAEHCERIDYGKRMELFGQCDYVVSATVSPNYTLTKELVAEAVEKPMVLIDLAVPRDIDADVRTIEGITLFDIDSFREEAYSQEQKNAIAQAEEILLSQMDEFLTWYECVDLMPLIQRLKESIARDLTPRLEKKLRSLPLEQEKKQQLNQDIQHAAMNTANKLLFGLRDGLDRKALRECLLCMENMYKSE